MQTDKRNFKIDHVKQIEIHSINKLKDRMTSQTYVYLQTDRDNRIAIYSTLKLSFAVALGLQVNSFEYLAIISSIIAYIFCYG